MGKHWRKIGSLWLCLGFLLGIHSGRLALWQGDDPEPVHIFYVRAEELPPADQILLCRGLKAATVEELYALLEDYL